MKKIFLIILTSLTIYACTDESQAPSQSTKTEDLTEAKFDREKWFIKKGKRYPYRLEMYKDVLYNDTIRALNKNEITELLGEPDYTREGHLYYRITQKQLFSWTIRSRTMVIKLSTDGSIEWIKIHE